MTSPSELYALADRLDALPGDWHGAGHMSPGALRALIEHALAGPPIERSVETGAGRSTVLLSRLSAHHTVFSVDDAGSLTAPPRHPEYRAETVTIVEGPTQRTLPGHTFTEPLDLVLLDGPHGYPFPELEYLCLYPHLRPGALLIVDDIHIPTIRHLFDFLREDAMFRPLGIAGWTSFFRRTDAPTFPPTENGWWLQGYNAGHFPVPHPRWGVLTPLRAWEARWILRARQAGGRLLRRAGRETSISRRAGR